MKRAVAACVVLLLVAFGRDAVGQAELSTTEGRRTLSGIEARAVAVTIGDALTTTRSGLDTLQVTVQAEAEGIGVEWEDVSPGHKDGGVQYLVDAKTFKILRRNEGAPVATPKEVQRMLRNRSDTIWGDGGRGGRPAQPDGGSR
jgi:hypothetical protein